ncbi:MAG: hypothetical protein H0X38_03685 [Planctomycetes bacterium]|nr:hypothetical protein [Planctomycetota bacterium]
MAQPTPAQSSRSSTCRPNATRRASALAWLVLLVLLAPPAGAEEFLIVNPGVTGAGLDAQALRDIFLGKRVNWDDGQRIIIFLAREGPSRDELLKRLGRTAAQFVSGWKRLVFTGGGTLPQTVDGDPALLAAVARTPGAVGFVVAARAGDGVTGIALP